MRLFYKIWLSGEHPGADVLSFAVCDDNKRAFYAEMDDYDPENASPWAREHIFGQFLGEEGFKQIIPAQQGLKAVAGDLDYCRERLARFLERYKFLEFVGRANYWEAQALLWVMGWRGEDRHTNLINIAADVAGRYDGLFGEVRPDLPRHNALRHALTYKHMARKIAADHERKKRSRTQNPGG